MEPFFIIALSNIVIVLIAFIVGQARESKYGFAPKGLGSITSLAWKIITPQVLHLLQKRDDNSIYLMWLLSELNRLDM